MPLNAGKVAAFGARKVRRAGERWFALRYGSETSGFSYPSDDRPAASDSVWYHPTEWLGLRRALRRLRPGPDDVFVDIGAGRGRAVLTAATMPFGRVVGVELDETWAQLARRAVDRNRHRLACRRTVVVTADALHYALPDDTTVLYLYCPFVGDTFQQFAEQVVDFVDRAGRPVRMVYNYPFEHNRLIALGRFEVVDVCTANWPAYDLTGPEVMVTYLVRPPSSLAGGTTTARPALPAAAACWRGAYDPGFVLERPGGRIWRSTPNWRPGGRRRGP